MKAQGKDVVELEIGDSPFPTTPPPRPPGIRAIEANQTGYGPSLGLPEFRAAAARTVNAEFGFDVGPEHVVVASGAKPFEQYFAEALLDPGDGVLIFSPHFPTYVPNLERRGARAVLAPLSVENGFRPRAEDVAQFLATDPKPRAVFLNSPHNPTGGVATREDLEAIADVVRGTDLMVFSDEPYCHMVWEGRHESIATEPGMLDHVVSAYTFSKSYSMSGWRIGFAVAHPDVVEAMGKLINTTASCSPPFVQQAAPAALEQDAATRDEYMARFRRKVERLVEGLRRIDGFRGRPAGRDVLRLPRRPADLQPAGDHLARPGPLPARRGRRRVRRRLPGRRVLRRGRARVPPVQLRRARRADRPGPGVPARRPGAGRPGRAVPGRPSRVRLSRAVPD